MVVQLQQQLVVVQGEVDSYRADAVEVGRYVAELDTVATECSLVVMQL